MLSMASFPTVVSALPTPCISSSLCSLADSKNSLIVEDSVVAVSVSHQPQQFLLLLLVLVSSSTAFLTTTGAALTAPSFSILRSAHFLPSARPTLAGTGFFIAHPFSRRRHLNQNSNTRSDRTRLNMTSSLSTNDDDDHDDDRNRLHAIHYMMISMSCLFGGYEFLRSAVTALFTVRFPHSRAYPLAMAFVSPFSVVALFVYTRCLQYMGPATALLASNAIAAFIVLLTLIGSSNAAIVYLCFLFQNMYLNLICSQQWSFCDSVIPKTSNAKRVFGRIAGISCAVSTGTALLVPIVKYRTGLLALAFVSLLGSAMAAHQAYRLAKQYGFDPGQEQQRQQQHSSNNKQAATVRDTIQLFRRVPILQALLVEAISFHSLSTVLNVAFVQSLSKTIHEASRTSYLGWFYAACNGVSAIFQFVILPHWKTPSANLWKWLPVAPIVACGLWCMQPSNAEFVAGALFCSKVMDYAIRSVAGNMVYQPLDFDSRFVGKEIIGVLGSRLGRSGTSLMLSLMPTMPLPIMGIACATWAASSWSVSRFSADQDRIATKEN